MKVTYDKTVDAMYIYLSAAKVAKTVPINANVVVDLDDSGKLVGVEVLDASHQVDQKFLSTVSLKHSVSL